VQYATNIMKGQPEPGWSGGPVPYSWGGGHGGTPGPSAGTCAEDSGYSGPKPCRASSTVGLDCSGFARWVYSLAYGG
jgi:cell wall-associated NlpC family hydrolase